MQMVRGGPMNLAALGAIWALALGDVGSMPRAQAGEAGIAVGSNVHVSHERADIPHREVVLAADPNRPNRLLAGSMIEYKGNPLPPSVAYASEDGGKSWRLSLERKSLEDRSISGDPAVAFGPEGTAYFATLARRGLFRSRDSGRTWEPPTALDPEAVLDREFLAVDGTGGRFRGRLYWSSAIALRPLGGHGEGASGIALYASGDGGESFDRPALRIAEPPLQVHGIGNGVVLSDGTFVVLYNLMEPPPRAGAVETPGGNARLGIGRSTDGGRTIERDMPEIDSWTLGDSRAGVGCLAADPGSRAFKDRLYAAWADGGPAQPYRIMASVSEDKGLTWSPSRVVSDVPDGGARVDAYLPALAVCRAGVVGVTWYDTRDVPGGEGWNIRFRASLDGGRTWQPSTRITEVETRTEGHADVPGDTAGLAASERGRFHALWIDGRTRVRQVWTATITVGTD
jgi:hypothetical protein